MRPEGEATTHTQPPRTATRKRGREKTSYEGAPKEISFNQRLKNPGTHPTLPSWTSPVETIRPRKLY
jgi:hypothetical protein